MIVTKLSREVEPRMAKHPNIATYPARNTFFWHFLASVGFDTGVKNPLSTRRTAGSNIRGNVQNMAKENNRRMELIAGPALKFSRMSGWTSSPYAKYPSKPTLRTSTQISSMTEAKMNGKRSGSLLLSKVGMTSPMPSNMKLALPRVNTALLFASARSSQELSFAAACCPTMPITQNTPIAEQMAPSRLASHSLEIFRIIATGDKTTAKIVIAAANGILGITNSTKT
mmetsp:Transcript_36709/g.66371  ORF Transcript_36709/g.66371 Transcript_36709/m.66371 type:complete len:227 (+) Transcript_36709:538-1218(+)